MHDYAVIGEAMRRRDEELRRARRRLVKARTSADAARELLEVYRDDAKQALERAIAAEDAWRRARAGR